MNKKTEERREHKNAQPDNKVLELLFQLVLPNFDSSASLSTVSQYTW